MDEHSLGSMERPRPTGHPRLVGLLIASIGLALAVFAYLFLVLQMPLPGMLGQYVSALMLPQELREAQFVSASPRGTVVFTHAGYTYTEEVRFLGAARTLVETAKGYAALETVAEGGAQRLVVDGVTKVESPSLRSVSASPDGRRIAYTETSDGSVYAADPSRWVVKVYYPDPGTTQVVGSGFAPFFIDDITIGYFTAAGIFAINLETGVPRALARESFRYPFDALLVSPDRTHLAWQDTDHQVHLYTLTSTGATAAGLLSFTELEGASAVTMGNQGLYTVRATNVGSEVWRRGYDGSFTRVVVLPPALETTRLMFNH